MANLDVQLDGVSNHLEDEPLGVYEVRDVFLAVSLGREGLLRMFIALSETEVWVRLLTVDAT